VAALREGWGIHILGVFRKETGLHDMTSISDQREIEALPGTARIDTEYRFSHTAHFDFLTETTSVGAKGTFRLEASLKAGREYLVAACRLVANGYRVRVEPSRTARPGEKIDVAIFDITGRAEFHQAAEAFQAGDCQQAISICTQVLAVNPGYDAAYNLRGVGFACVNDHVKAIGDFTEAIRLYPGYAAAYENRAKSLVAQGQLDRAIADLNLSVQLYSQSASAYLTRGVAWERKGDFEKAIADYSSVIGDKETFLSVDRANALAYRARAREAQGDLAAALADAAAAQKTSGKEASYRELADRLKASWERAQARATAAGAPLAATTDFPILAEAISYYGAWLKLRPSSAETLFRRGDCWLQTRQYEKAVADFSSALAAAPSHPQAHLGRGAAHSFLGRYQEAIGDFSRAIVVDPKNAEAWRSRALARAWSGDRSAALADLNQALALAPGHFAALMDRGKLLVALGKPEESIVDFTRAIEIDRNSLDAVLSRGDLVFTAGKVDQAAADFARAAEIAPRHPEVTLRQGDCWFRKGDYQRAVTAYSQAIEVNPALVAGWVRRGMAWEALGDLAQATADAQRAQLLDAKNPEIQAYLTALQQKAARAKP
jgi:tetratricopeptide (TPR) repeat protein